MTTASPWPAMLWGVTALAAATLFVRTRLRTETLALRSLAGVTLFTALLVVPVQAAGLAVLVGLTGPLRPWGVFAAQAVLVLPLLAALGGRRPVTREAAPAARPAWRAHVVAAGVLVALTYVVGAATMAVRFAAEYDALTYHLVAALRAWQDGTFRLGPSTHWQFGLPLNGESLAMLVLSTGHDRWAACAAWPALLALGAAVYETVARPLDQPRAAAPVALLVLSLPMVFCQAFSGYIDLFGAAFVAASAAFALAAAAARRAGESRRAEVLRALGGLACGLAAGTKPTFWPFAAACFVGLAATPWVVGGPPGNDRRRLRSAAALVGWTALPCAFWFARAWAGTGNPFFPLEIRVGGRLIFPGYPAAAITRLDYDRNFVRSTPEWLVYPWTEWRSGLDHTLQSYTQGTGVGAVYATFVPLALAAGLFETLRRRDRRSAVGFVSLFVLTALWWTALRRVPRFGLPVLVLSCVLSAPAFGALEAEARRSYRLLFLLALTATLAIVGFEPLRATLATVRRHDLSRRAFFGYPAVVDSLPRGSRLLNLTDEEMNFPLAGSRLANRVVTAAEVPGDRGARALRSLGIDYVITRRRRPAGSAGAPPAPPGDALEPSGREARPVGDDGREVDDWTLWRVPPARRGSTVP